MKKYLTLFISLISTIILANTSFNGNMGTSWIYTFESNPSHFYFNGLKLDLYIKPEDNGFSGDLNLNKSDDDKYYVTDGEFNFRFDSNTFKTLWKKKSVNTGDWINAFNNEKVGAVNGFKLELNTSLFQAQNYLVKKDEDFSSIFLSYIRGIPLGNLYYSFLYTREYLTKYNYTDWRLFDFSVESYNTQFFGEFGYSYEKGDFYLEDNYLAFLGYRINLNNLSNKIFFKYVAPNYNKKYLPDSFVNNIRNELYINKWGFDMDYDYFFKDNKISINNFSLKYLKGYLNYDNYNFFYLGIPVEEYNIKNIELSINIPFDIHKVGDLNFSFYKKGLEDDFSNIKNYNDFSISANLKGDLLGYYYDLIYIFGNKDVNIENSTIYSGGFSEVLYGSLSKSFGDFNLYGKGMYIYGVVERYKTMYLEAKYTGFQNMEMILGLGDGNFGASKELKKQISITVKTGF